MKVVYKYRVDWADYFSLELPLGAEIIHFGIQRSVLHLWALVDSDARTALRWFRLAGTGHRIDNPGLGPHVGTVIDDDHLVWHLFEMANPAEGASRAY